MEDGFTDIISIALAAAMLMFPVKDAMEQPVRMLSAQEAAQVAEQTDQTFSPTSWSTRPIQLLNSEYGYAYITFDISRALYTENSRLYLVHVTADYTPGYIAYRNGETYLGTEEYNKNSHLSEGYLKLSVKNTNQPNYCNVNSKAMWPKSDTFTTTITSEFGFNATFSNDLINGIEIGNGGNLSASAEAGSGTSLSFSFIKEKSTVSDDPYLSAQYSSGDNLTAIWNFEVRNHNPVGRATYTLDVFYLLEVSPKNGLNDEIRVELSIGLKSATEFLGLYFDKDMEESVAFPLEAVYH